MQTRVPWYYSELVSTSLRSGRRVPGAVVNLDPAWLREVVAQYGLLGPWEQDGNRWVRRWITRPTVDPGGIEGQPVDVVAVVEFEDGGWFWLTPWDCDGDSGDAASAMKWCDSKLPVAIPRQAKP